MSHKPITNLIPKIRKQLLIALDIIEKENIKKITNKPTNIKEILIELRTNIESENHWATFYLIQIFSERIADFLLIKERDNLKHIKIEKGKKYFTMEELVVKNRLSFNDKIFFLEKIIYIKYNEFKDFKIILNIMKLLCFIRNRYMFHMINYDEYSFIYKKNEIWKKEEHFIKNLEKLVLNMNDIMKDLRRNSYAWHLLERNSSFFKRSIEYYKKSIIVCKKKNGRRTIDNTCIYEQLPGVLSTISYVFILFLGRKNLKLFSEEGK